jgi:hypothetical protein
MRSLQKANNILTILLLLWVGGCYNIVGGQTKGAGDIIFFFVLTFILWKIYGAIGNSILKIFK